MSKLFKAKVQTDEDKKVADALKAIRNDGKTEFSVYDAEGRYIRVYTLEVHGENAGQLANQFATKIKGTVK